MSERDLVVRLSYRDKIFANDTNKTIQITHFQKGGQLYRIGHPRDVA